MQIPGRLLPSWVSASVLLVAVVAQSPKFREFLDSPDARDSSGLGLSRPMIGYDGKIYACCKKNLLAFESGGYVAWIIPLNYSCRTDIAPVGDERGKIFLIAEERVLKIKPSNMGSSDPVVETFYDPTSTGEASGEIVGLSISISSSALFITVRDRGIFAFMLRGTLLWSAGPVLSRFGYRQGCKQNVTDCYFKSAPVVDQCEGSLYISNTEGQLYALYTRNPHFRWIQDFSSIDKDFLITPGNNGRLYLTFSRSCILMALDVSTGNILWKQNVGPLSSEGSSPVVDSNGWVSIGSLDGFLYSISPTGDIKKFLKASAPESVILVSPVLDCSGFAVYVSRTSVVAKVSHVIGGYTYISAMNVTEVEYILLSPATGSIYWTGAFPDEVLFKSDLSYFRPGERILLALLASEGLNVTWPCYTARERLSWTCSRANAKLIGTYTASEKAILLFLLFQSVIVVLLATCVRFCWIFWRKKKLKGEDLCKFLEKRHSLHVRKREFDRMISDLEEKATDGNGVLEQLEDVLKAREGVERKLSTTYSLGRDGFGSGRDTILPSYDAKTPKSYSFRSGKEESVTIFNILGTDSSSSASSERSGWSEGNCSDSDDTGHSREDGDWRNAAETELARRGKGKSPVGEEEGPSCSGQRREENWGEEERPVVGFNVLANPLFATIDADGRISRRGKLAPGRQGNDAGRADEEAEWWTGN